jgi:hypothetical protein
VEQGERWRLHQSLNEAVLLKKEFD